MLKNMRRSNTEEFIEKAKIIHGDKYDYSKVEYINNATKVCIICKEHGEFWQTSNKHLNGKQGCPKCGKSKSWDNRGRITTEEWVNLVKKVHGDKYDYSKVEYINNNTKVCIICPIHGEFWQLPINHLFAKQICPKCAHRSYKYTTEEWVKKAMDTLGDRYDYSKVEYKNNKTKVCIICPIHGEFWQKPINHLNGHGCPICKESKLEKNTKLFLTKNNIEFETQKHFDWLGLLSLDFYIPNINLAIECQGKQHFGLGGWSNKYDFEGQYERDKRKKKLCQKNNVNLQYINYDEDVETKLIEILNQYGNTTNM